MSVLRRLMIPGPFSFMPTPRKYSYSSVNFPTLEDNKLVDNDQWTKQADPNYDAATRWWGDDWRMPTFFEMIDLFQYTKFTLPGGEEITSETIFDPSKSWIEGEKQLSTTEKKDLSYAWNTHEDQYNLFRLCSNWKKEEKVKRNVSTYRCRAPIIPSKESMVVFSQQELFWLKMQESQALPG